MFNLFIESRLRHDAVQTLYEHKILEHSMQLVRPNTQLILPNSKILGRKIKTIGENCDMIKKVHLTDCIFLDRRQIERDECVCLTASAALKSDNDLHQLSVIHSSYYITTTYNSLRSPLP